MRLAVLALLPCLAFGQLGALRGRSSLLTAGGCAVSTTSLPAATLGTPYTATLAASGCTAPLVWVVTGGGLPLGLALASNGDISGTPIAAGYFGFTVQVTDSAAATSSRALVLIVGPFSAFIGGTVKQGGSSVVK